MDNNIFKDLVTEDTMREAHNRLYDPKKDSENLKRKTEILNPSLEELIFLAQKTLFSVKNSDNKRSLEDVKVEFDKVAFILNKTIQDFEVLYEEIFALHTAEKLAGTFDQKDWTAKEKIGAGKVISGTVAQKKITKNKRDDTYFGTSNNEITDTF